MTYEWVTEEMFQRKLEELVLRNVAELMSVVGVYEAVSEHYNNDVLEELEDERAATEVAKGVGDSE